MANAGASNTVTIPLPIRIGAYLATMLPFDATVTWVIAEKHVDIATAVLFGALLSSLHGIAGMLALAHLTLPATLADESDVDATSTSGAADGSVA